MNVMHELSSQMVYNKNPGLVGLDLFLSLHFFKQNKRVTKERLSALFYLKCPWGTLSTQQQNQQNNIKTKALVN